MPMGSNLLSPTICSALAFALYGLYQWLLPKPLSGIAYNAEATKSLFGDAPEMLRSFLVSKDFGAWCAHQVEKMKSPICQVFIYPFSKPWILVADFRESQDILMRRKDFDRSTWVSDAMGALGDFHARMKTNKDWKRNRRWMQDLMTPSFLNTFVGPAVHSKGLELVKLFEIKMNLAKGRPFNVRTDFEYASVDCMTDFAFGQNLPHTTIGPQIEFTLQMDPSKVPDGKPDEPVVFSEAPLDHSLKQSWFQKVFSHKNQVLRAQIEKAVKDYRAGEVKTAAEHMVMREAAYAEKHDREPDFETHVLIDEIFGVVVAGHHTTGGAMGWIAKYLTGHPAIQSKLRSALYTSLPKAVSEKRFPTFDELRRARIPYLDAVIEEMLRLTAVTVTREALYDTQILGQHIPKGSTVFLVSNGPGFLSPSLPVDDAKRSPTSTAAKDRSWDETKDLRLYDPERWLVHNGDSVEFDGASGHNLALAQERGVAGVNGWRT
ncbi:MAG: hypothetical protein Q9180_000615 [Flavoplaca navasiana]